MATILKTSIAVAATALLLSATAAFADHHFAGTWKVKDTSGTDFEIMLGQDGAATANRAGEGMSGKWVEKDGEAVITWSDGWTTKIAKDGDGYKKTAFEGDTQKNTSAAEKVK